MNLVEEEKNKQVFNVNKICKLAKKIKKIN
jgi:hypothetical protein